MNYLGSIRNPLHDGLFLVLCDGEAPFGGWDVHGDELAAEGSTRRRAARERGGCFDHHTGRGGRSGLDA
ncbi:hypothetical protein AB0H49_17965 [Nocardia sp. NPDC050713]|uniref:hypothetical protein n=1 Tax=Nocardia sp. NPDC050713 TaxID=3154511 RepID=UPI0033C82BB6